MQRRASLHERWIRARLPLQVPLREEAYITNKDFIPEKVLTDLQAELRKHPSTKPWANHPRLYTLLRLATSEDLANAPFIEGGRLTEGLSDFAVPYTKNSLPTFIREKTRLCDRMISLQVAVFSDQTEMGFGVDTRVDIHKASPDTTPFTPIRMLRPSHGSCGQVQSVRSKISGLEFVRKSMQRCPSDANSESDSIRMKRLAHFENEVAILRKLDPEHRHLITLCGTYTDETNFSILTQPVAERTLGDLLAQPQSMSPGDVSVLREACGCLALGLAWLHSKQITHNDIKPANILLEGDGTALFCDFGSAEANATGHIALTEKLAGRTKRYVPPEIIDARSNILGDKADVWSLGCVFLEIFTTLANADVHVLLDIIRSTVDSGPDHVVCYWEGLEDNHLSQWITGRLSQQDLQEPSLWTRNMLAAEPTDRYSAPQLFTLIQVHSHQQPDTAFIRSCCAELEVPTDHLYQQQHSSQQPNRQITVSGGFGIQSIHSTTTLTSTHHIGNWNMSPQSLQYPPHIPSSHVPSPSSPVDSARHANHTHDDDGLQYGTLVFTATLARPVQILEIHGVPGTFGQGLDRLRLHEAINKEDLGFSERHLVLRTSHQSDSSDDQVLWLPLADISVERFESYVLMSWSDCSHLRERSKNGRTHYSRVYERLNLNNALSLCFETAEVACNFVSKLHTPFGDLVTGPSTPIKIKMTPTSHSDSWKLMEDSELRHRVAARISTPASKTWHWHTVEAFRLSMTKGHPQRRGLRVKGCEDTMISTSRLYWLPVAIDLVLPSKGDSNPPEPKLDVTLFGLDAANYLSGVQEISFSQPGDVGTNVKVSKVEYLPFAVRWKFESSEDMQNFLSNISDWSLKLCLPVKCLSREKKVKGDVYGEADLLLFVHKETANATIAFKLSKEVKRACWVTGRLPTSGFDDHFQLLEVSINLSICCRGKLLHLESMQATSTGAGNTDGENHRMKILFHTGVDVSAFRDGVTCAINGTSTPTPSDTSGQTAKRSLSLWRTRSSSQRS